MILMDEKRVFRVKLGAVRSLLEEAEFRRFGVCIVFRNDSGEIAMLIPEDEVEKYFLMTIGNTLGELLRSWEEPRQDGLEWVNWAAKRWEEVVSWM